MLVFTASASRQVFMTMRRPSGWKTIIAASAGRVYSIACDGDGG